MYKHLGLFIGISLGSLLVIANYYISLAGCSVCGWTGLETCISNTSLTCEYLEHSLLASLIQIPYVLVLLLPPATNIYSVIPTEITDSLRRAIAFAIIIIPLSALLGHLIQKLAVKLFGRK